MDYAKNKDTEKDVKADEVYGGVFICPVCCKSVHYVRESKNGYKRPHFAHNKSEGTQKCENYHPNHYSTPSTPSLSSEPNQSTENQNDYSFHLDIVLSKATLKVPAWYLTIAQKSIKAGYFNIKQGLMGEVHASFSRQTEPIPVVTQNQDYQIEIPNNADFEDVVTVSGLVVKTGNIFTHKGDYGRRLSNQEHLYWGQQYFLVWHKNYNIACPSEIMQRALVSQENWECLEIQLPNKPNNLITDWVERFLERKIQAPAITLSLVTPSIYKNDEDTIQIKDSDEVVIAVTEPLGNKLQGTLVIKHEMFQQRAIDFSGSSQVLIDLGRLRPGKTTLRLNSSSKLLVLNCIRFLDHLMPPSAVSLTFKNGFTADAYSLKIRECLQIKNNPLKKIEFPVAMRFRIQTQSQHFFVVPKKSSESLEEFQGRALQAINEIIETEKRAIQLDFGPFGQPLLRQEPIIVEPKYTLSKKEMLQLQWLANLGHTQLGRKASGEGMRMLQKLSQGELKKYFRKINHLPAIAEPYLRTLASKLKNNYIVDIKRLK